MADRALQQADTSTLSTAKYNEPNQAIDQSTKCSLGAAGNCRGLTPGGPRSSGTTQ
jgi:hypothetical protein